MTPEKLAEILAAHKLWLNGEEGGVRANLREANLSGANLRGAKELLPAVNFIDANFERVTDGYIAYKTFNSEYAAPESWTIAEGSVISENVNFNRCEGCGCGELRNKGYLPVAV